MTSTVHSPSVRFAGPLGVCLTAALVCIAPPAAAQAVDEAEAVTSFLSRWALEMVVEGATPHDLVGDMVGEVSEAIREGQELTELMEMLGLECLEQWDEMIHLDRIDCLRPMMRPFLEVVEQVPGLGTLMMTPDFITLGTSWSVEQDGGELFLRVGPDADARGEVLFFDGARLTVQFRGGDGTEERYMLLALTVGDEGGRDRDAAALEGPWALVQLDDLSLRDLPAPAMIQEFRADGSFRMSTNGGDAAPHLSGLSPAGRWRLSISRAASASLTGEPRTRLLVLASDEGDLERGHHIFAVEQLDGETLVLVDKGGPGRSGGSRLHFRRQ